MDAGDLKVFEAVARLGSMNRAAVELNTVQSNVTGRIRALELEFGTSLFERHARGVSPTAAAQRLLPYALTIRQMLKDARKAARDDGVPAGPLMIGSLETTAAMRLAPLLADYAAAYPDVDLSLRTGTTCELIEDVLAHRVEGGLRLRPCRPSRPHRRDDVPGGTGRSDRTERAEPRRRHPQGRLPHRCSALGLLLSSATGGIPGASRIGRRARARIRHAGSDPCLTGAGLGVTLLPRDLVENARRAGQVGVHALPPEDATVDTVFLRRRDGYVSSALTAFLAAARPAWATAQAAE